MKQIILLDITFAGYSFHQTTFEYVDTDEYREKIKQYGMDWVENHKAEIKQNIDNSLILTMLVGMSSIPGVDKDGDFVDGIEFDIQAVILPFLNQIDLDVIAVPKINTPNPQDN